MARPAKPWFWKERDGWYITLNGKRIRAGQGQGEQEARRGQVPRADARGPGQPRARVRPADGRLDHRGVPGARPDVASRPATSPSSARSSSGSPRPTASAGSPTASPFDLTQWLDANPDVEGRLDPAPGRGDRQAALRLGGQAGAGRGQPVPVRQPPARAPRDDRSPTPSSRRCCAVPPAVAAGPFRQVLIFLRFTGCRPGEMAGLKWSPSTWTAA